MPKLLPRFSLSMHGRNLGPDERNILPALLSRSRVLGLVSNETTRRLGMAGNRTSDYEYT